MVFLTIPTIRGYRLEPGYNGVFPAWGLGGEGSRLDLLLGRLKLHKKDPAAVLPLPRATGSV